MYWTQKELDARYPVEAALREWRAARMEIFTNTVTTKGFASGEEVSRWRRLADAEHALMKVAVGLEKSDGVPSDE